MKNLVRNPRSRDWWMAIFELTADNNALVVDDGGGSTTVTVPTGYYVVPTLMAALANAISSATSVTVTLSQSTPTRSPYQYGAGTEIVSDGALTLEWSDGATTIDPRLLGHVGGLFPPDVTLVLSGGSYRYTSPDTSYYVWRSYTIGGDGIASQKRAAPVQQTSWSHQRPQDRYAITWEDQYIRRWVYRQVPAAHVFEYDASNLDMYAINHRVSDSNNAFVTIWDHLEANGRVLVVHDQPDAGQLQSDIINQRCEVVALHSSADSPRDLLTQVRIAGDYWDLSLSTYYLGDTW